MSTEIAVASDGLPFTVTTLSNTNGMQASFMDWGATLLSLKVPVANQASREVVLGCATMGDYLQQSAYLGATVGRYANRIRNAQLLRTGDYLAANQARHQLHGGPQGFSHRRWDIVTASNNRVDYQLISAAGDQGFPGQLTVQLSYQLHDDNRLEMHYQATTTHPTPLALTNHSYFNLNGDQSDIRQHRLFIDADYYQPVDHEGLPCAPLTAVTNTGFDFRRLKTIADDFLSDADQKITQGYDHAFLINQPQRLSQPVAKLTCADEKVWLYLYSDLPALQCYTGNFLSGTPARSGIYANYEGIALEPGYLPDSANHPEWPQPDCWLQPTETHRSSIIYQFMLN